MSRNNTFALLGGAVLALLVFTVAISVFQPRLPFLNPPTQETPNSIPGSASTFRITDSVATSFGNYIPPVLEYTPQVPHYTINKDLSNVNMQGLSITSSTIKNQLATYGFSLVDEGVDDIYKLYDSRDESPKLITTDLCLHAYHVLYDISLRILEGTNFTSDFELLLDMLRQNQQNKRATATAPVVQDALDRNIAYLSVMLFLLDNSTYPIPSSVLSMVTSELANIQGNNRAYSAIFGYEEDYSQYKVRGHYTRNEILTKYFQAMMYAGRMGFLVQSPTGDISMGINHTRMSMLLISSFNSTDGSFSGWDYWDRVYEPTVFYVGASDDLTPVEYYKVWQQFSAPEVDQLEDESLILDIISVLKTFRKPKINSMLINEMFDAANVTQGFRLMGQRFIPDSYIFQELVHTAVGGRLFPNGLDVMSVFGSPRAAIHLQAENETYPDYSDQVLALRAEFGNLSAYDWTQNLYWLWLYSLFPLLSPATEGYPAFMLSDAWTDKTLMTTMGSWAELRHDTILYAKQSYTYETSMPGLKEGYVEPYPEVYSRLASLVQLMEDGLNTRGLLAEAFRYKLNSIKNHFDYLTTISIKELENIPLNETDYYYISYVGEEIGTIASYNDPDSQEWTSEADDRMAIIADVHTDPNSARVLEVGTGNPFTIYTIVPDSNGNLRLTRGGSFSYYEFKHPMNQRLSDEEWHTMLDSSPPPLPDWILENIPIVSSSSILIVSTKEE